MDDVGLTSFMNPEGYLRQSLSQFFPRGKGGLCRLLSRCGVCRGRLRGAMTRPSPGSGAVTSRSALHSRPGSQGGVPEPPHTPGGSKRESSDHASHASQGSQGGHGKKHHQLGVRTTCAPRRWGADQSICLFKGAQHVLTRVFHFSSACAWGFGWDLGRQ